MRIVSVCPSNTDLMAHLGLLDWVVGRDTWSDWPEGEVENIPLIGPVLNLDIEAIEALQPDLILASRNVPGMERMVPKLEATGLPMVVYDPETWQDVLDNLRDLGHRLGVAEHAETLIQEALNKVKALQQASQDLPWLDLLVEWWPDPLIVPFKETYVNEVLSWVKVQAPFHHYPGRSGQVTRQAVIEANPDMYAISWCGTPFNEYDRDSVFSRYADAPLRFMAHPDRVFFLWEGIIGHPSLRLLDGAQLVLEQRLNLKNELEDGLKGRMEVPGLH